MKKFTAFFPNPDFFLNSGTIISDEHWGIMATILNIREILDNWCSTVQMATYNTLQSIQIYIQPQSIQLYRTVYISKDYSTFSWSWNCAMGILLPKT